MSARSPRFLLCFLTPLMLLAAALAATAAERPRRPNVVVILADDAGWGDLSLNGNRNLETPHLDSLGRDGAQLDRFYVCSVCAPTRAEFLTGRYHPRGGVRGVSTGQERLNTDERTLADAFRDAGYATGAFGKWHNGSQWPYHPNARGFQQYYGFTSGHWGEYVDPPLERNGRTVRGKGYIADLFTTEAVRFVEQNRSRPFFCYLAFNTPHHPWSVPDSYWERFRSRPIVQRGSEGERENLETTRCALAMMENLDWNVGRVLERLKSLKLDQNTVVVYFNDNGPNERRWNGGMKGIKGSTDEGGVRSPCLIRFPGRIQPGTTVKRVAGAIDLMPTLTGLAGIPPGATRPMDGRDLSPLLRNQPGAAETWPDRRIFSHQNGAVSVRTDRYRLDAQGGLFDMVADPGQRRRVNTEQPETAALLASEVAAWRADVLAATRVADSRPFPVGHREFPLTPLPARDGVPQGTVRRSAAAPNCSYFVNWSRPDDTISWDVEVKTPGRYEAVLHYTCPLADAGSTIQLSFQGAQLEGVLSRGWDPPLYTNQDTLPRPTVESRMKPFKPFRLGEVDLPAGRGPLTLRALRIPGGSVMDLRQLDLRLKRANRSEAPND